MKTCRTCYFGVPIVSTLPTTWFKCRWQENIEKPYWYSPQNPGAMSPDVERECECYREAKIGDCPT